MTTEELLRQLALSLAKLENKFTYQLSSQAKQIGKLEAEILLLKKENMALCEQLFELNFKDNQLVQ